MAPVGQSGGGTLAHQTSRPGGQLGVSFGGLGKLEQQRRVFITGKQAEKHPFREAQRPFFGGRTKVDQVPVFGYAPDVACGGRA
ncbi:MAG: hypothetical protein HY700_15200 [Gemmatimonadetes bacterium]|nr:hypothetical protein [Gemmatimonadota bacterium]